MTERKKYTILTYIFGDYEKLRDPLKVSENCEYLCVTDNPNLKSNVWKLIYDEELNKSDLTNVQKAYKVKNLWLNYINTPVGIRLDGSILILENCDTLIEDFLINRYDVACMLHNDRDDVLSEYDAWTTHRGNDPVFKQKFIDYCESIGFDYTQNGLVETMLVIQRNNDRVKRLNEFVYNTMMEVNGFKDHPEQIWFTLSLMLHIDEIKPCFLYKRQIVNSRYFQHYIHNTDRKHCHTYDLSSECPTQPFMNKMVESKYII